MKSSSDDFDSYDGKGGGGYTFFKNNSHSIRCALGGPLYGISGNGVIFASQSLP